MTDKEILNFFFELGQLRRIKHEGWRLAGIEYPDSVAEHSLRAAQIGLVLAHLETYENPLEVCAMLVFHDIGECRIGDLHKVANRYVQVDEDRAVKEQLVSLGEVGESIYTLWKQVEHKDTRAGIIAKDADYVEQGILAKEYVERGYVSAEDWIKNTSRAVKTDSAKRLLAELPHTTSTDWWHGLKKL
ncbi:HD domain-containing protein [Candidatus Uhrbacteria bacterium]|nr:HD domain-containing protein [Candidatus Uhrbacteria bacterium]